MRDRDDGDIANQKRATWMRATINHDGDGRQ